MEIQPHLYLSGTSRRVSLTPPSSAARSTAINSPFLTAKCGGSTTPMYGWHIQTPIQSHHGMSADDDEDEEKPMLKPDFDARADLDVPSSIDWPIRHITPLALLLGTSLTVLTSILSTILHFKLSSPPISPLIAILLSKLVTRAAGKTLGLQEGAVVSVMAGAGATYPYAADVVVELAVLYRRPASTLTSLLLITTSQLLGLCLAPLFSSILVRPAHLTWPSIQPTTCLLQTLYSRTPCPTSTTLFFYTASAAFIYQFLPSVFAPTLASMPLLCLAAPATIPLATRKILTALGSGYQGFGLLTFSLDWSSLSLTGPLFVPLPAALSFFAGFVVWVWIVGPTLWIGNFWGAREFPRAVGAGLFDRNLTPLDIGEIVNVADLSLNETALKARASILLNPNFALSYGCGFAALSSAIVSVMIWHGPDILRTVFPRRDHSSSPMTSKRTLESHISTKVPSAWFVSGFATCFVLTGCLALDAPIQIPLWAMLTSIALGAAFIVPCGVIAGLSGSVISLNIISELICGLLHPGSAVGNMLFKVYCQSTMTQSLRMSADLKVGLETQTPGRSIFFARIFGTILSSLVSLLTIRHLLSSKLAYLDDTLHDAQWSGRQSKLFGAASVTFGLLGPKRFFAGDYAWLYLGFLIGAVAPVLGWCASKRWKGIGWEKVSWPLVALGAGAIPEMPSNLLVGLFVTLLAQWWAPRYAERWFQKSRLVMSAALDAGTALSSLIGFVTGLSALAPIWWGNPLGDTEHCML